MGLRVECCGKRVWRIEASEGRRRAEAAASASGVHLSPLYFYFLRLFTGEEATTRWDVPDLLG